MDVMVTATMLTETKIFLYSRNDRTDLISIVNVFLSSWHSCAQEKTFFAIWNYLGVECSSQFLEKHGKLST